MQCQKDEVQICAHFSGLSVPHAGAQQKALGLLGRGQLRQKAQATGHTRAGRRTALPARHPAVYSSFKVSGSSASTLPRACLALASRLPARQGMAGKCWQYPYLECRHMCRRASLRSAPSDSEEALDGSCRFRGRAQPDPSWYLAQSCLECSCSGESARHTRWTILFQTQGHHGDGAERRMQAVG